MNRKDDIMGSHMFLGWVSEQWDIARPWYKKKFAYTCIPDSKTCHHDFECELVTGFYVRRASEVKRQWDKAFYRDPEVGTKRRYERAELKKYGLN